MRLYNLPRIDRLTERVDEPHWTFCPVCNAKYVPGEYRSWLEDCPVCEGREAYAAAASAAIETYLEYVRTTPFTQEIREDLEFLADVLGQGYAQFEVRRTLRFLLKK